MCSATLLSESEALVMSGLIYVEDDIFSAQCRRIIGT
jgi:hypothetical protein